MITYLIKIHLLHYYLYKVRVQKKLIYFMFVFHVNKSIGIYKLINK